MVLLLNHMGVRESPGPWCYGLLFEFELWLLDQHLIPYVLQLVFANIFYLGMGHCLLINIASLMALAIF